MATLCTGAVSHRDNNPPHTLQLEEQPLQVHTGSPAQQPDTCRQAGASCSQQLLPTHAANTHNRRQNTVMGPSRARAAPLTRSTAQEVKIIHTSLNKEGAQSFQTTRSGRLHIPPLAFWCNQKLIKDAVTGDAVAIARGSPDLLRADPRKRKRRSGLSHSPPTTECATHRKLRTPLPRTKSPGSTARYSFRHTAPGNSAAQTTGLTKTRRQKMSRHVAAAVAHTTIKEEDAERDRNGEDQELLKDACQQDTAHVDADMDPEDGNRVHEAPTEGQMHESPAGNNAGVPPEGDIAQAGPIAVVQGQLTASPVCPTNLPLPCSQSQGAPPVCAVTKQHGAASASPSPTEWAIQLSDRSAEDQLAQGRQQLETEHKECIGNNEMPQQQGPALDMAGRIEDGIKDGAGSQQSQPQQPDGATVGPHAAVSTQHAGAPDVLQDVGVSAPPPTATDLLPLPDHDSAGAQRPTPEASGQGASDTTAVPATADNTPPDTDSEMEVSSPEVPIALQQIGHLSGQQEDTDGQLAHPPQGAASAKLLQLAHHAEEMAGGSVPDDTLSGCRAMHVCKEDDLLAQEQCPAAGTRSRKRVKFGGCIVAGPSGQDGVQPASRVVTGQADQLAATRAYRLRRLPHRIGDNYNASRGRSAIKKTRAAAPALHGTDEAATGPCDSLGDGVQPAVTEQEDQQAAPMPRLWRLPHRIGYNHNISRGQSTIKEKKAAAPALPDADEAATGPCASPAPRRGRKTAPQTTTNEQHNNTEENRPEHAEESIPRNMPRRIPRNMPRKALDGNRAGQGGGQENRVPNPRGKARGRGKRGERTAELQAEESVLGPALLCGGDDGLEHESEGAVVSSGKRGEDRDVESKGRDVEGQVEGAGKDGEGEEERDADGWTQSQLKTLQELYVASDPTKPNYWSHVAKHLGKTPEECFNKFFNTVPSPTPTAIPKKYIPCGQGVPAVKAAPGCGPASVRCMARQAWWQQRAQQEAAQQGEGAGEAGGSGDPLDPHFLAKVAEQEKRDKYIDGLKRKNKLLSAQDKKMMGAAKKARKGGGSSPASNQGGDRQAQLSGMLHKNSSSTVEAIRYVLSKCDKGKASDNDDSADEDEYFSLGQDSE